MRVVVLGGTGQVGRDLVGEFRRRGRLVTRLDRDGLDITDHAAVERVLARLDPAVIVNCAAYTQVDVAEEEPQAALLVNALAVRNLAMVCRQLNSRLVHFSTDYVFDGAANRPYGEDDRPRPLNAYAVSKLAGELYAQAYLERALIVRTSGVYGPGALETPRGNFVELMLRLANSRQTIRVVEDHIGTPTYAPALAERAAELVERGEQGVFHLGGGHPISWFEFAQLIFRVAGIEPKLRPTNEREYRTSARRPRYSALSNAKAESRGIAPMPPLEEAVRAYFAAREKYNASAPR
jgi:dTDP-4-dehydrorhamnose reductase